MVVPQLPIHHLTHHRVLPLTQQPVHPDRAVAAQAARARADKGAPPLPTAPVPAVPRAHGLEGARLPPPQHRVNLSGRQPAGARHAEAARHRQRGDLRRAAVEGPGAVGGALLRAGGPGGEADAREVLGDGQGPGRRLCLL